MRRRQCIACSTLQRDRIGALIHLYSAVRLIICQIIIGKACQGEFLCHSGVCHALRNISFIAHICTYWTYRKTVALIYAVLVIHCVEHQNGVVTSGWRLNSDVCAVTRYNRTAGKIYLGRNCPYIQRIALLRGDSATADLKVYRRTIT